MASITELFRRRKASEIDSEGPPDHRLKLMYKRLGCQPQCELVDMQVGSSYSHLPPSNNSNVQADVVISVTSCQRAIVTVRDCGSIVNHSLGVRPDGTIDFTRRRASDEDGQISIIPGVSYNPDGGRQITFFSENAEIEVRPSL